MKGIISIESLFKPGSGAGISTNDHLKEMQIKGHYLCMA